MPKRSSQIDILKVIAIFIIVGIHVPLFNQFFVGDGNGSVFQYALSCMQVGVPIFVFVNGYLTIGKTPDVKKQFKKIARTYLIFMCWCVIHLAIISRGMKGLSFTAILENLTTVYIGHPYLNILWFMVNLLQLYFFIPVLQSTFLYSKKVFYSFFVCVSIFVFLSPTMSVLKNLVGEVPLLKGIWIHLSQFNFLGNGVFVFYAMYGAIVRDLKDRLKPMRWIPIGVAVSLVCILYGVFVSRTQGVTFNTGFVYDSPFAPFMVMLFYMLAGVIDQMIKSERVVSAVQLIGANTLGIYFCHLLIIFELYTVMGFSGENMNLALRFLFSVFVLFASTAVVMLLKKIPLLRELV